MKNKVVVSLLLYTVSLAGCDIWKSQTSFDIDRYEEYVNRLSRCCRYFMPSLDSLTDYKDISVSLTSSDYTLGKKDTNPYGLILFVSYDEEIFDSKKDEISQNYIFVNTPIISEYNDDDILMPAIDIVYCDYRIRVVYDNDFYYPKYFGMIGINENNYTIAYLYYQDINLDRLASVGDSIEKQEERFIHAIMNDPFVFPDQQ